MSKRLMKLVALFLSIIGFACAYAEDESETLLLQEASAAFNQQDQEFLNKHQHSILKPYDPIFAENNFSQKEGSSFPAFLPDKIRDKKPAKKKEQNISENKERTYPPFVPEIIESEPSSPVSSSFAQNSVVPPEPVHPLLARHAASDPDQNDYSFQQNRITNSEPINPLFAQNKVVSAPQTISAPPPPAPSAGQNSVLLPNTTAAPVEQIKSVLVPNTKTPPLEEAKSVLLPNAPTAPAEKQQAQPFFVPAMGGPLGPGMQYKTVTPSNAQAPQQQIPSVLLPGIAAPPSQTKVPVPAAPPQAKSILVPATPGKKPSSLLVKAPPPGGPTPVSKLLASKKFQAWLEANGFLGPAKPPSTAVSSAKAAALKRIAVRKPKILSLEESQRAMLDTAPSPLVPAAPDSREAFNAMLQQNMPLTPRQVVRLRQQIDVAQRAAAIAPTIPPKPVSSTLIINLAPGTTPPAVRLSQGYVSSLVFVDSTGTPWPIASFDIGYPKAVNIQWDGKSNILLIQAVSPYSDGNIVVRLVGLPTPITLELVAGQRVVDYRVDIHVPGIGPNTKELPIGVLLPSSANQMLLDVLDGIAPNGSKILEVTRGEADAFLLGDRLFLRTRHTLLSPGWISTMVSPDGMHAYELTKTSSILVSRFGKPAELRIEGL